MSDHDFEKKVQLKMDELKLTPSAGVWASVEKNIRRDRRRRRALIWLPLFFLLLGGSGYFLFMNTSTSSSKNINTSSTSTQTNTPVASNAKTGTTSTPSIKTKQDHPAITAGVSKAPSIQPAGKGIMNGQKNSKTFPRKNAPSEQGLAKAKYHSKRIPKNNSIGENSITSLTAKKGKERNSKDNTSNEESTAAGNSTSVGEPATNGDVSKHASSETTPVDSAKQLTAEKDNVDSTKGELQLLAPQMKKFKEASKINSKWRFGLTANMGMSKTVKGANIFEKSAVASSFNALPPAGASTSYGYPPASPVYPGFTFSIGGYTEKSISKRVNISLGLQYTYMSTITYLGNRIDSARIVSAGSQLYSLVSNYYPNSNAHQYTNSYHFIDMPVSIEWKFNEKKKLPFSWTSGLQLMQLLGTNAVHYDASHGIYYKNNSYFNRTQLGIFTGLSFETFRKSKRPVWIGPRVDYLISNLLKKNVSGDQHLFSAGISAKMLLKK